MQSIHSTGFRQAAKRSLSGLVCAALSCLLASTVWAQGDEEIEFDLGDVTDEGGEDGDGGEGTEEGGDDLSFSVDDVSTPKDKSGPTITALVLPTDELVDPLVADTLTGAVLSELDQLTTYQSRPNDELRARFDTMGATAALECVYDPLCVANIGRELNLQRVLIVRLGTEESGYAMNIDLINVDNSAVEDYVSLTVSGGDAELHASFVENMSKVLKLKDDKAITLGGGGETEEAPKPEPGPIQKAFAWGTAGLAVVMFGVGIYFGLDASSQESELSDTSRLSVPGSPRSITEEEANKKLDDAESSAVLANVFYGLSLASAATSVLLFLITPGQDIATEEELDRNRVRFDVSPILSPDGTAGVGASWTF